MTEFNKIAELLLKEQISGMEKAVDEKLDETKTAFEAKLDGLKAVLNGKIDEIEAVTTGRPLSVTIGTPEKLEKTVVHSKFFDILNILKSQKRLQKNIMLVGEAGSGKTHLANSIADALGLEFYPMSVGLQTTKSDLLGFINAHGEYITSPVREAFEKGGVLLLDEFDSTHAGVVTIINALLANGHCSFPDKIVEKHPNFVCLVACNTYGHGANVDYVGRNRLDGATLDRFVVINVGYDKKLEKLLTNNNSWLAIIEKIRKNVEKQGIKMIISPRASMNGADLLDAGFKIEDVIEMTILKGADKDIKQRVLDGIDLKSFSLTSTEAIETTVSAGYVRNTDKYYTIVFRTEEENLDNIQYYRVESVDYHANSDRFNIRQEDGLEMHFNYGNGWSPQFDSSNCIYLSTHGNANYNFREYEKDCLKDFLEKFEIEVSKNQYKPQDNIAIEFIKKGYRNPWKTIVINAEEE